MPFTALNEADKHAFMTHLSDRGRPATTGQDAKDLVVGEGAQVTLSASSAKQHQIEIRRPASADELSKWIGVAPKVRENPNFQSKCFRDSAILEKMLSRTKLLERRLTEGKTLRQIIAQDQDAQTAFRILARRYLTGTFAIPKLTRSFASVLLGAMIWCPATATPQPQVSRRPPIHKLACNSGPAPQVSETAVGTYVHLVWAPVPGATAYAVQRFSYVDALPVSIIGHVITPPLYAGEADTPGSSNFGYWDAVPEAGRAYWYKVSAIQRGTYCAGTVTTPILGPLLPQTPSSPHGTRSNPTSADLSWNAAFGALFYRISGPGLPSPWLQLKAGTYTQGSKPAVAVDQLTYHANGSFSYTVSQVSNAADANYQVATVFPNDIMPGSLALTVPEVRCQIYGPIPDSGLIGTIVSIKGSHFDGVQQVNFATVSVLPLSVIIGDSNPRIDTATVSVPDLSNFLLPQKFYVSVDSQWGRCTASASAGFEVTLPSPVTVPDVHQQSLQNASMHLQQAGLLLGSITAGSTAPAATVVTQDRQPGAKVPPKTAVNVSTQVGVATSGFKEVRLQNKLASQDSIHLWMYDYSTGQYSVQNNDGTLSINATTTITLPSNHLINILAVDPTVCGGLSDPSNTNCVPWQEIFFGSSSGSSASVTVQ